MKAILTPVGSDGDVLPFVAMGVELARRGHDVLVITNGHFEPMVRHAGLPFAACGTAEQYRRLISGRGARELRRHAQELMGLVSRDLHRAVQAHHSPGNTVLVAHVLAAGTRIVRELQGAPLVTILLCPAALPSVREPALNIRLPGVSAQGWLNRGIGWLLRTIAEYEAGRILKPYRAGLGLPPERLLHPRGHLVGLFPEWFGRAPDWPGDLVLAGFPSNEARALEDDPGVEDFLREGAAPIVFTPGTGMVYVRAILEAAVDACRRLNRRGILLTRYADQVPARLPESVRHFPYVELDSLLPRAVALVHHGGIGTCARGLAAGIPQVILPYGFDQFDNMARLERLGVGWSTPWRGITGRALARALQPLIGNEAVAARARTLAERFRGTNGIDVACDAIERVAVTSL